MQNTTPKEHPMSRNLFHDAIHALTDEQWALMNVALRARELEVCNNCDAPIAHPNPGGYCDDCLAECEVPICSSCGIVGHDGPGYRTDDGEFDEDCQFRPYFDGDGFDLRRRSSSF